MGSICPNEAGGSRFIVRGSCILGEGACHVKDPSQIPTRFNLDFATLPPVNYHGELMHAPRLLNVTPEDTNGQQYINFDAPHCCNGEYGDKIKVGIVWGGNPAHRNDHHRSCPLRSFEPLAQLCNVKLFSSQNPPPFGGYCWHEAVICCINGLRIGPGAVGIAPWERAAAGALFHPS